MNGHYLRLALYNYTGVSYLVFMNDRPVGDVDPYKGLNSRNETVPGGLDMGEYPICNKHVLDARGEENSELDQKFCSTDELLACSNAGMPDYCEMGFLICDQIDPQDGCITEGDGPVNFVPPPKTDICLCQGGWEKC
jgi:hypothetical protein